MKKLAFFSIFLSYLSITAFSQCGGLTSGTNSGNKTITGACSITGNVTISSGNVSIGSGASLTISGFFDNNGNGSITINGGTMDVGSYFRNDGNGVVTITGGGVFDVGGYFFNGGNGSTNFTDGTITIGGNFTNDGNGTIAAGGTVSVGGDFTVNGNGNLNISGGLSVDGALTSTGNADVNINNGGVLEAGSIDVDDNLNINSGGTLYVPSGDINVNGTLFNDPGNGDQVCTNNCCGAQCNSNGDGLNSTAQQTLPVTLLYFQAEPIDHFVELTWATATEVNTSHFELYRSDAIGEFHFLEEVPASGNSKVRQNYSCMDFSPTEGLNLYQLVSVDFDGYREAFSVQSSISSGGVMKVFPNPSDGVELNVSKPSSLEAPTVRILTLSGQVLFNGSLVPGQTKIKLENSLKSGLYILTLQEGNQIFSTQIAVQ